MAIIKLSVTERRRLSAFITCLVLAGIAWVFTTLSNTYNYNVKQVLTFRNGPQWRAFHSLQSDTVDVTVQGSGWQMLFSKINAEDSKVAVDLHTLDSKNYVVLSGQLKQINRQREAGQQIIAINPDTLYFDFTNRIVKKVPVKLQSNISYQQRFALAAHIGIKPAYVTISGPSNRISHITEWPTDSLKLRNINETVGMRLNLRPVTDGSIMVYPRAVEVSVPVDEFTEKTLELPIKLLNRSYNNVKILPQSVKVTFLVSLTNYADTDAEDFEAAADLDLWKNNGYSTLPVKLTRIPPFCKIINLEPRNIDFIVKK